METPCPAPNVQFSTRMSAAIGGGPPDEVTATLSSPVLILQPLMWTCLHDLGSMPSVLGEFAGAVMVTPVTVMLVDVSSSTWNFGEFCNVTVSMVMPSEFLRLMRCGRYGSGWFAASAARCMSHHGDPPPSMVPVPVSFTFLSWLP